MTAIIMILVSGFVSIVVAYFTSYYKTWSELDKERARAQFDIVMKQKHEYYLPFKYSADEFKRRLLHIVSRLEMKESEPLKYENMMKRLKQNINTQNHDWYFNDSISSEGGYFLSSTVYMNCVLFYWMRRIQTEHPFIPLQLDKDNEVILTLSKYKECSKEEQINTSFDPTSIDVYDFIKNIKIAISRADGIPYGLHDSLGDFLYDVSNNRLQNYEEFCQQLQDEHKRIKFLPIIKFWTGIITENWEINKASYIKIKMLLTLLDLLDKTRVREN